MKTISIAIIETPTRCGECPLAHEGAHPLDEYWCQLTGQLSVPWKVPESCPLLKVNVNELLQSR